MPGGPERAGAKSPAETLSAGRAAAPSLGQDGTLGRGRSAARVILAFVAACLLVGPVTAQTVVKPGDTGQIEYPIELLNDSAANIEGLTLSVTAPAYFIVKATSIKGPLNATPGETKTFVIDYEIAAGAPDGQINADLHFTATTEGIAPDLDTLDTSVILVSSSV